MIIGWGHISTLRWGWNKMVAILQTTFSTEFSRLKIIVYWLELYCMAPISKLAWVEISVWRRTRDSPFLPQRLSSYFIWVTQPRCVKPISHDLWLIKFCVILHVLDDDMLPVSALCQLMPNLPSPEAARLGLWWPCDHIVLKFFSNSADIKVPVNFQNDRTTLNNFTVSSPHEVWW